MQHKPHGGHERQGDERGHDKCYWHECGAGNGGDEAAAAKRARDAHAERDVGRQVECRPAAEAKRRHRGQLVADVGEGRLRRERKQDDAGDHRQMQVRVEVPRQGDARRAASVAKQPLRPDREEIEFDMLLAYDRTLTRRRGEAARAVSARTRTLSAAPGVRTDPEVDDG